MNLRAFFSLLLCVGMTTAAQAQPITAGEHTRVTTVYGPIEGYKDGNIFTFKGIPYAKATALQPLCVASKKLKSKI